MHIDAQLSITKIGAMKMFILRILTNVGIYHRVVLFEQNLIKSKLKVSSVDMTIITTKIDKSMRYFLRNLLRSLSQCYHKNNNNNIDINISMNISIDTIMDIIRQNQENCRT